MEKLQRELEEERSLTISSLPDKGRCIFTTKDFYPGEVIISQEPYVCVPNNSAAVSRCDGCFASVNLKKCSSCHAVWYCGRTCQKSEWKLHRQECQALARLDKDRQKFVTPTIRMMINLYIRRNLQSDKSVSTTATDSYDLVKELVSHMAHISEKQLILYSQMANLVKLILQWPDIDIKEVASNFSKLACNAHSICDSEFRPLGTGLFPVISIVNHSCIPNSVLVFEGKKAVVRAVQHIPKGSEVLINYIETAGSTVTRQKALREQYLFTCTCPRCCKAGEYDDIQESAVLEGYRCKNSNCHGFLLRDSDGKGFSCQQCGIVRDKEEIKEIATEVKSMSNKADILDSSGSLQEALTSYKTLEKLQTKMCHPFSIYLMQTREKLMKILMELGNWREALSYCRLTLPVYERAYPRFHPLLGLQYYTCGKLEWLLGETKNAVMSLTKAVDILRVTHGTNSPFVKELMWKVEEAHAEASYKPSTEND